MLQKVNPSNDFTLQCERDFRAAFERNLAIDVVFIIQRFTKSGAQQILVGRPDNAPDATTTLPQVNLGMLRWGGYDDVIGRATMALRDVLRFHSVSDAPKVYAPHYTYFHRGYDDTKKLLAYCGVELLRPSHRTIPECLKTENKFVEMRWETLKAVVKTNQFSEMRDSGKQVAHFAALNALS
jgi:hypothetical protein